MVKSLLKRIFEKINIAQECHVVLNFNALIFNSRNFTHSVKNTYIKSTNKNKQRIKGPFGWESGKVRGQKMERGQKNGRIEKIQFSLVCV